jgi:hypothetical protein
MLTYTDENPGPYSRQAQNYGLWGVGGCKLVNENDPNPPTFDNNNWISNGNAEINTIIIIIRSPMAMQK